MNSSLKKHSGRGDEAGRCLARSVVNTLAEEPALEAVTIDRTQQKISVATLGRVEIEPITKRLTHQFEAARSAAGWGRGATTIWRKLTSAGRFCSPPGCERISSK